MSTTVQTTRTHHSTFGKAALWLSILALVAATAWLASTAIRALQVVTAPAPTAVVEIDTTAKTAGGFVRPFETTIDAATAYVPVPPAQYQDQPPAHLQQGPVM